LYKKENLMNDFAQSPAFQPVLFLCQSPQSFILFPSIRQTVCLPVNPSAYLPVLHLCPSIQSFVRLPSIRQTIRLSSVCPLIHLLTCLSCIFVCPSNHLYVSRPSVSLSVHQSVCLSINPSAYLPILYLCLLVQSF
jgi:hypothetical protein